MIKITHSTPERAAAPQLEFPQHVLFWAHCSLQRGGPGSWAGPAYTIDINDLDHDKQQSFSYKNTHFYGKPEFLGKTCKTYTSVKSHIWHIFEKK